MEETGWKLVHGDVFRPPPKAWLLTSFVGSGVQISCMVLVTLGKQSFQIHRGTIPLPSPSTPFPSHLFMQLGSISLCISLL